MSELLTVGSTTLCACGVGGGVVLCSGFCSPSVKVYSLENLDWALVH